MKKIYFFKQSKWKSSWNKSGQTFIWAELFSSQEKQKEWALLYHFGFKKIIGSYVDWVHFRKYTRICTPEHVMHA